MSPRTRWTVDHLQLCLFAFCFFFCFFLSAADSLDGTLMSHCVCVHLMSLF
jgi:hypothetical protein